MLDEQRLGLYHRRFHDHDHLLISRVCDRCDRIFLPLSWTRATSGISSRRRPKARGTCTETRILKPSSSDQFSSTIRRFFMVARYFLYLFIWEKLSNGVISSWILPSHSSGSTSASAIAFRRAFKRFIRLFLCGVVPANHFGSLFPINVLCYYVVL